MLWHGIGKSVEFPLDFSQFGILVCDFASQNQSLLAISQLFSNSIRHIS